MRERRVHTTEGKLRLIGWRNADLDEALRLGVESARAGAIVGEFRTLRDARVYYKASPLRGEASARHGLRRALLRRPEPRLAEYYNLSWLIERLFQTPLPLAAGVFRRGGLPRYQFLLTQELPGCADLRAFMTSEAPGRADVLAELAREVARMHALSFIHRDLFPRNLLVGPETGLRRLYFLDAWRGGPRPQRKGPAYDLACLLLHSHEWLAPEEQARFLADYARERAVQGRPVGPEVLRRALATQRAALLARLSKRPHLLRGRELPPA